MSSDDLKQLPPPEKKVAAKIMYQMGWGSRKIEELLGVDHTTVTRYAHEATPEALQQFATDFELAIKDMKMQGVALVQKRLLELIPKERRIDQVVKAGEFLEGKSNMGIAIQANSGGDMSLEFISDAQSKAA